MARWQRPSYQALSLLVLGLYVTPRYVCAGNITVDDANSDLQFSTEWRIGQTCGNICHLHPDLNFAYGRTWHDATRNAGDRPVTVNYTFKGTDLYVYGIMSNVVMDNTVSNVNLILKIDDADVASFAFQPLDLNSYQYNTSVFAVHDLSDESHRMSVVLQPNSQFSFDYLIYTTGGGNSLQTPVSNSSGSSPSNNTPVIAGAVAGGVVLLLILAAIAFFFMRRRRRIAVIKETVPPTPAFIVNPYPSTGGSSHLLQPNPTQSNGHPYQNSQGVESGYTTSEANAYSGIESPSMGRGQAHLSMQSPDPTLQGGIGAVTSPGYISSGKSVLRQQQQRYVGDRIYSPSTYTEITEGSSGDHASPPTRHGGAIGGATPLLSGARPLERERVYLEPRTAGSSEPSAYTIPTEQPTPGLHEKSAYRGLAPVRSSRGEDDAATTRRASTVIPPPPYYAGPPQ